MARRSGGAPGAEQSRSRGGSRNASPSAPPPPASRGSPGEAPRAPQQRSAGRFAGNARQDDDEFDVQAERAESDSSEEMRR